MSSAIAGQSGVDVGAGDFGQRAARINPQEQLNGIFFVASARRGGQPEFEGVRNGMTAPLFRLELRLDLVV